MGSCRYETAEGLIRDGANVAQSHGRRLSCQFGVHSVQDGTSIERGGALGMIALSVSYRAPPIQTAQHRRTLIKPDRPSVRTSHPFVHARSLGECPTPTGCIRAPSLLPSSRICLHCSDVVGANTRVGRHLNVRAQLVKVARDEFEGIEMGSRAFCNSNVGICERSAMMRVSR
jgi:hypothetical protein